MTIRELFEEAWRGHWDKPRYRASGWAKEVRQHWTRYLEPTFGSLLVTELGPRAVRSWHESLFTTPTTANRCLEVLSRMYRFGQEEELIALGVNPCQLVKAYTEKRRKRFATPEEMRAIGEGLREFQKEKPLEVAFIRLIALSGARPQSIAKLKKKRCIERNDGTIVVEFDGKETAESGEDETLIFPASITRLLPKREDGLLIGPVDYRPVWEKVRRKAGCKDLWLRDLRRTYGTVGLGADLPLDTVGELLNHKSTDTTKRYAMLLTEKRVSAARVVAGRIGELLEGRG